MAGTLKSLEILTRSTELRDRLYRLGRDVAVYGELIYDRFGQDRISGGGPQYGFAPWHVEEG